MRTTVINNNIGDQGAWTPQFSFCQPIKIYKRDEIKSFYLKSYLGLSSNLFKNVMQ